MKQQRDATYVYSQFSVTPPLQKRGSQASKLPPELGPLGIINITNGSEWSWFPPPPGRPDIAFKLIEDIRKESEDLPRHPSNRHTAHALAAASAEARHAVFVEVG